MSTIFIVKCVCCGNIREIIAALGQPFCKKCGSPMILIKTELKEKNDR